MEQPSNQPAEPDVSLLLGPIRLLHERIRDEILASFTRTSLDDLAQVNDDASEGDTIYAIDRISENLLIEIFDREVARIAPLILIGEGLPGGEVVLPRGMTQQDAVWRVIVDPIDGTRGLMYQKKCLDPDGGCAQSRSANKLAGHCPRPANSITLTCLCVLTSLLQGGCSRSNGPSKSRVAFVTNNAADFWTIARKGCEQAGKELPDIEVEFKTRRRPRPNSGASLTILSLRV